MDTLIQNQPVKSIDTLTAYRRIQELRYKIGRKRVDMKRSKNPRLILMMFNDIQLWEREITALINAQPKVLGFRDMVDYHMSQVGA